MYFRWSELVNCFYSRSCCVGAVFVVPVKAISLLKSPSKIMLLCRLLWMWLNIVVCIVGMWMMSSISVGMYRCIRKYGVSRRLVIFIICKYGEISLVVGILVILPRNAYFWCIRLNRPPLGLLYGWPLVQRCWIFVFVLLNIILYS